MVYLLLAVCLILIYFFIKWGINNYDKLSEEEKEDVIQSILQNMNKKPPFL